MGTYIVPNTFYQLHILGLLEVLHLLEAKLVEGNG